MIGSSDQTHLTNYSGDKKLWPVYITLANILTGARSKPSQLCNIVIALLPIPPKHSFVGKNKKKQLREARLYESQVLVEMFKLIFGPVEALVDTGKDFVCPDGKLRRCFPIICGWIADYSEAETLNCIKGGSCPVCEAPVRELGDINSISGPKRKWDEYLDLVNTWNDGDANDPQTTAAGESLDARLVLRSQGAFWGLRCVAKETIVRPDVLHTILLGLMKYVMDWVVKFVDSHDLLGVFETLWVSQPYYPGFKPFTKSYTHTTQWQGKEMRNFARCILPILAATLNSPKPDQIGPFREAILCVRSLIYFYLMTQYKSHTDATIGYMRQYLKDFHEHRDIFRQYRAYKVHKKDNKRFGIELRGDQKRQRESEPGWSKLSATARKRRIETDKATAEFEIAEHLNNKAHFDFIKMHLLGHMPDHIKLFGCLNGFTADLSEHCHKELKDAFRASNKVEATPQVLKHNARRHAFLYRELNLVAQKSRRQRDDGTLQPLTRRLTSKQTMKSMSRLPHIARWNGIEFEAFQYQIAWYMKRFRGEGRLLEYSDEFSLMSAWRSTLWGGAMIPRSSFQCEEDQENQMVRCTGKKPWRRIKPPRNDFIMLKRSDLQQNGSFESTGGRIPARLRCLFSFIDPLTEKMHRVALVSTLIPKQFKRNTGLIVVEAGPNRGSHNPQRPPFGAGAEYIVPLSSIEGPVFLSPFEAGLGNTSWFLNNTVDLDMFNQYYD